MKAIIILMAVIAIVTHLYDDFQKEGNKQNK